MKSTKIIEIYDGLAEDKKVLVLFCAITGRPQSRKDLLECLRRADVLHPSGTVYTQQRLKFMLEGLEKLGVLSLKGKVRCHPALDEYVMRRGFGHPKFKTYLEAVRQVHPLEKSGGYVFYGRLNLNHEDVLREIRLALYNGDIELFNELAGYAERQTQQILPRFLLEKLCSDPFEPEWLDTLIPAFRDAALQEMAINSLLLFHPGEHYMQYLLGKPPSKLTPIMAEMLAQFYIVRGQLKNAADLLAGTTELGKATVSKAMIALLRGDIQTGITLFRAALKEQRKSNRRNGDFLRHYAGPLYPLALLAGNESDRLKELQKILIANYTNDNLLLEESLACIRIALQAVQATGPASTEYLHQIDATEKDVFSNLLRSLILFWFFPEELKQHHYELESCFHRSGRAGYRWLEMEFAVLLHRNGFENARVKQVAETAAQELQMVPLVHLVPQTSAWERRLNALQVLSEANTVEHSPQPSERLVYFVSYHDDEGLYLQPRLQKLSKNGIWSKGRTVNLAKLANGEPECMTTQDHAIARTIHYGKGFYGYEELRMNDTAAALAAAGHPLLFMAESPQQPVEIIRDTPAVHIRKQADGFVISFSVEPQEDGIAVVQEAANRYRVLEFKEEHRRVAAILGNKSVYIPPQGEKKLRGILSHLSGMVTIYSTLEGEGDTIETIEADNTIHGHLIPIGEGFKLELLVKPVGTNGPFLKPGAGSSHVLATIDSRKLQARRNLQLETESCEKILESCPTLRLADDGTFIWQLDDPQTCLQTLLELGDIPDLISLEWPEGQTMKIQTRLDLQNLSVRIEQQQDWFALSGNIKLNKKTVMKMHKLLELMENSPAGFIKIKEGEFIALTAALQRRLDYLKGFPQQKNGTLEVHPGAAFALEELLESLGSVQLAPEWETHMQRLKSAESVEFDIPSTLQTELRDYQVHGFKWLARLAYMKFGACLADDMGLGKTIQALAILLMRAKAGPALVVAPASVTFNWANEVRRFAPTLRIRQFGQTNRAELISKAGPFDIMICSYGLLQSEIDLLTGVVWETIVLDEAQAIKNAATKRSKAAMKLRGRFKMITTGTPLENHLGELWTLFNFINPGLLGSLKSFNSGYAIRITKFADKKARLSLKRLLQPFILRRLKSDVLDELPPKTEINLNVELSADEAAFYEALRQKALENISGITAGSSDSRFKVFAELMKLRRACCHTKLVASNSKIVSTKLNLFMELVKELLENRHKVLVFSQFVDHLKIIEEALKTYHISYQYLDGSTPIKQRKKRVEAFQAGEGDLFLISLRAGGTGLNLTAADYVIHMDPWWNPAVEDQASDRAHRIGQERPVTVYRFVTSNTIEEKIIDLHSRKRDLADSLLEGTDSPERISVDELVALLKER